MKVLEGNLVAEGLKIGIVAARFNEFIVSKLIGGAEDALKRHGVREEDIELAWVPGAFEIPLNSIVNTEELILSISEGNFIKTTDLLIKLGAKKLPSLDDVLYQNVDLLLPCAVLPSAVYRGDGRVLLPYR